MAVIIKAFDVGGEEGLRNALIIVQCGGPVFSSLPRRHPEFFEPDDDFGYEGSNLHNDNQADIIEQNTFFTQELQKILLFMNKTLDMQAYKKSEFQNLLIFALIKRVYCLTPDSK